jgi:hypothetical protein
LPGYLTEIGGFFSGFDSFFQLVARVRSDFLFFVLWGLYYYICSFSVVKELARPQHTTVTARQALKVFGCNKY